jgi:tetratricopeptide (TPR) repeat protein
MPNSDTDRNLLFGVLALQADLLDAAQFVEACTLWANAKDRHLADLLVERGWLTPADKADVERLLERKLKKHGDAHASLAAVAGPEVRRALDTIQDADVEQSLASLAPVPEHASDLPTVDLRPAAGRYRVLRPHARGGLGEVFVAEDTELHRNVALKEIQPHHAGNPHSRQRFVLEAEVTGGLEHPGVVAVYGLGTYADGRPFYAMRLIQGESLKEALTRFHQAPDFQGAAFRQLLRRFVDVCNALAYAHSRGVLHRDLKPANVMLGPFGETLVVDWGLAKVVGRERAQGNGTTEETLQPASLPEHEETAAGSALGTPAFMSPEQAAGRWDELGPASDVYSLGATLYAILTGRAPFEGSDKGAVLRRVQRGAFPPPPQVQPAAPAALDAVCRKAMSVQAADRYPTPLALAQDVERWLADEAVSACRDPLPARLGRWARKHRTLVTTGAAVALVALVALAAGLAVVGGLNRQLDNANADLTVSNSNLVAARAEAEAKKTEAETERNIAVAVSEFLQKDLLGQADIGNQPFLGGQVARNPNVTVAQLLDRAARVVQGKFQDQPATEAAIRRTIGDAYRGLGKYELARPHLERSLAVAEQKLGADHPDTLTTKCNLATLYQFQGQYARAETLYVEALRQQQKRLGADHSDTLTTKHNLAWLYQCQGQYARAETLLVDVLRQREQQLGADNPGTLLTKHNLGVLYQVQGQYARAETLLLEAPRQLEKMVGADHPYSLLFKLSLASLYEGRGQHARAEPVYLDVLRQSEKTLGADHPNTLLTKHNLAALYKSQGQYARAETLLLEVLRQREQALGADHPDTLTAKCNLASLYHDQGQYAQAETLYVEALRQQQKRLGADHPHTLTSKNNLALLYQAQGQYAQAETLFVEVLGQKEKKLGADHPHTLTSKHNLALLYRDLGQYTKAEPLFLEVLRQTEKQLGADHPHTLATKHNLALLYRDLGQYTKAEPLFLEVLRLREQQLGADHPRTADSLAQLGLNLLRQHQYAPAEQRLRDALRVCQTKEPGAWRTFKTQSLLGEALLVQQKYAEAEPLLLRGYEGLEKQAAKIPAPYRRVRVREALERLVQLYDATNKKDEADRWRKKLEEMKEAAAKEAPKK